jgi:hypothetical protein
MRKLSIVLSAALLSSGCGPSSPTTPATPVPVVPAPALPPRGAEVEVGGPQGGVHVQAPARVPGQGTNVDVDQSGVHVRGPNTQVDVP